MSVLDRFRLDGKHVLLTGASRGLGRAMALALVDAGATAIGGRVVADIVSGLVETLSGLDPQGIRSGGLDPKFLGNVLLVAG